MRISRKPARELRPFQPHIELPNLPHVGFINRTRAIGHLWATVILLHVGPWSFILDHASLNACDWCKTCEAPERNITFI